MGIFITFEGIEGCGKTTQLGLVADSLDTKGFNCLITREPGGTGIGEKVRKILLSSQNSEIMPVTELFLYMASRSQHVEEVIKPALADNKIVLCDRFSDATIAYQAYARGIDLESVKELNQLATSGLKPDITVLLDCPVDIGLARATGRMSSQISQMREDRFEREDISFHQRVREGYLEIGRDEDERVLIIDGTRDMDIVHEEICKTVFSKITEGRGKNVI